MLYFVHGLATLNSISVMVRLLRRTEISISSWLTTISAFWLMAFYFLLNTRLLLVNIGINDLVITHFKTSFIL